MLYKGALSLLSTYGSDSSDDDVPGPRVSTKRVHKSEEDVPNYKRSTTNKLLPVPKIFQTNTEEGHVDNPLLHDGRIRSFSHERGNWATYVYIPFEPHDGMQVLILNLINTLPKTFDLKKVDHFHISLTKTVILKYHWIQSFVESVKSRISFCTKFMILFDSLKIYCNEERTRTFIGLHIQSGYDTLIKLVGNLDKCLDEFNLPTFYKNPSFHMSIAWCIGDYEKELSTFLPELNDKFNEVLDNFPQDNWYIFVDSLFCKTGNKCFTLCLP